MRNWIFLLIVLFSILKANGQRRIGVVDVSIIQSRLIDDSKLDCQIEATKDTLQKRSLKWKADLGKRMGDFKNLFDGSPSDWKRIEDKIKLEIGDLEMLGQIINDSLPAWRMDVLADFDRLIQQKAKEVAKAKKLSLVIDAKSTLYFEGKLDLTNRAIEKALQEKELLKALVSKLKSQADRAMAKIFRPTEYFRYPGQ